MAFQSRKKRRQLLLVATRCAEEMTGLHQAPFARTDGTPEAPGNALQDVQGRPRAVEEGHV